MASASIQYCDGGDGRCKCKMTQESLKEAGIVYSNDCECGHRFSVHLASLGAVPLATGSSKLTEFCWRLIDRFTNVME